MKNLLLLNSSLVVNKPILSRDVIKIEYGKARINSYEDGFKSLQKFDIFKMFDEIIMIDNTISSKSKIPKNILQILPENTIFLLHKDNELGRANKGAGMLNSLKKNISVFEKYNYIFYFEPRLLLKSSKFIEEFLDEQTNSFSIESYKRVKTGYFGTIAPDFIDFLNSFSPEELVKKNQHIELLMYKFYEKKIYNFQDCSITLWKNYLSEIYEEY